MGTQDGWATRHFQWSKAAMTSSLLVRVLFCVYRTLTIKMIDWCGMAFAAPQSRLQRFRSSPGTGHSTSVEAFCGTLRSYRPVAARLSSAIVRPFRRDDRQSVTAMLSFLPTLYPNADSWLSRRVDRSTRFQSRFVDSSRLLTLQPKTLLFSVLKRIPCRIRLMILWWRVAT